MAIKPLADRVLVEALEAVEKTSGGIVLPESAKEKPQEGKIIAVGKGKVLENGEVRALEVKVGDHVMYGKYGAQEIVDEKGRELLIMREDDIIAVIS